MFCKMKKNTILYIQTRFYEGSPIVQGFIQTILSPINLRLAFSTDLELAEMLLRFQKN